MRVTKAEEYGIRLVMSLATSDGQLTIHELADREALPKPTVAKIVARLRRAEIVRAERGRNGGYSLAAPPEDISLARIVDAFDQPIYDRGFCRRVSPGDDGCARAASCGLRPVWRGLGELVNGFLDSISLADIIGKATRLDLVPIHQPTARPSGSR